MTFTPVSNIWALGSSESNEGALRCISHRSAPTPAVGSSRPWPITLNTWPSVASPTGTVMPLPVLRTTVPLVRPSVGFMAMARTRWEPICWATSATIVTLLPSTVTSNSRAVLISGSSPWGNSASMTGPAMPTMWPSRRSVAVVMVAPGCFRSGDQCSAPTGAGSSDSLSLPSASAPLTISMISVVMASWRAWFISRESLVMSSSALSVAAFMAR